MAVSPSFILCRPTKSPRSPFRALWPKDQSLGAEGCRMVAQSIGWFAGEIGARNARSIWRQKPTWSVNIVRRK
jgi:hypothetical protein